MGKRTRRVVLAALAAGLVLPASSQAARPARDTRPAVDERGAREIAPARVREGRAELRRRLGGTVRVAPATDRTRSVLGTDGALSAPAAGDRADVARAWVHEHRAAFGLDARAVDGLVVAARSTAGAAGITTVRLAQRVRGVPVFDGDLEVALDRGGRVIAANGEPVDVPEGTPVTPERDLAAARRALDADVGPTTAVAPGELVLFPTRDGLRLAWRLLQRRSSEATYAALVDAADGRILLRQNLTKPVAPATTFPNYPGAPGPQNAARDVDLEEKGWLPAGARTLRGPYARVFSDLDDDDAVDADEEITPGVDGFRFPFVDFCTDGPGCTWDPGRRPTARVNREQNGVQAFSLINRFRDHLARPGIDFDAFAGQDPVIGQTRDGNGEDAAHLNNANMTTLPEGSSPVMQMYLFRSPFRAIDGGDDAATVWHEYAHGLTGRLVTHSDGTSALSSPQAAALGEAWSDFYALDLLHREDLEVDGPAPGEVDMGRYSDLRAHETRTQGADCAVGVVSAACPGGGSAGAGGYTAGDFGKIDGGGPEVHADGEIWLELLWDVRRELGSELTAQLVTDALRLTPPEPTYVDARDALLAAETANGGTRHALLWRLFAARGLGFYASSSDGNDVSLTDDVALPPTPTTPRGTLRGRVSDADTTLPVAGVRVGPGGEQPSATTDADGAYELVLPAARYEQLRFVGPAGYDAAVADVAIPETGAVVRDQALRRDWASLSGGASTAAAAEGCGPRLLFDETPGSGWSAFRTGTPSVGVDLPTEVDLGAVVIDPTPTCGDGSDAAVRRVSLQVTDAAGRQTTQALTLTNANAPQSFPLANARGARRVRLTLLEARGPGTFIGLTSFSLHGRRTAGAPRASFTATPGSVTPGAEVAFDASGSTSGDSPLANYAWDFDGNGVVDVTTDGPRTTTSYTGAGTRTVRLTVRDRGGMVGEASAAIAVVAPADTQTTTAPPPPVVAPPTPTTPVPAPVVAPVVVAPDGPSVRVAARGRRVLPVTLRCASRCSLRARATVTAPVAQRLRRSARTVVSTTRTSARGGAISLVIPRAVRDVARRRGLRFLTLAVTLRVTDAAGRTASRRATVRVTL